MSGERGANSTGRHSSGAYSLRRVRAGAELSGQVSALTPAEVREVTDGVEKRRQQHRENLLRIIGKVFAFAVIPIFIIVIWQQLRQGTGSPWMWFQMGSLLTATLGASVERLSFTMRGNLFIWGISLMAATGLLHYGPLFSVGVLSVIAVLFSSLLKSDRFSLGVIALLQFAIYASALNSLIGPADFLTGELLLTPPQWIRISATSTVGLLAIWYLLRELLTSLWKSLGEEIALRIRERKLIDEREKVVRTAGSAQRLESLGRLAGGIAHDFNNSLVVIQCGIDALEDDLSPPERAEIFGELAGGVDRAAGTARQLLSFAKRNVEEIGTCDPADVAERSAKDWAHLLPAHVKLEFSRRPCPRIALSETAVEQLILILLQNAREALADTAGTITLQVEEDAHTGGAMLTVSDTGPGMSPAVAERIWEPFFTTKGERSIGLGLATVWGMVRRHGGEVTLDSIEGEGATLTMHFPAAAPEERAPESIQARRQPAGLSEVRVLILEDEAPVRNALKRILKHTGLSVEEASTVEEARLALEKGRFRLLISDGVLPDGGVGKFIQHFRETQDAPVILCSGYLEEDLVLEGVAQGQCSYLPKPFSGEDLTKLVAELLTVHGPSDN